MADGVSYLLVALEMEMPETSVIPAGFEVCFTGVGKINASLAAAKICARPDCRRVINYGTAGTLDAGLAGQLVRVARLAQRDMDARPLAPLGTTPFEEDGGMIELGGEGVLLSTGDNFVTSPPTLVSDIVDMEGYAIAKACARAKVPFECFKFVTDLADEEASANWRANVAKGGRMMLAQLAALSARRG
jgi:adenosylhomocysteine nucleosidase